MNDSLTENLEGAVATFLGLSIFFLSSGIAFAPLSPFAMPLFVMTFVGSMVPIPFLLAPISPTAGSNRIPGRFIVTGLSATRMLHHEHSLEIPMFSGIWLIGRRKIHISGRPVFSVIPEFLHGHLNKGTVERGEVIAMFSGKHIHKEITIGEAIFTYDKPWHDEYVCDLPEGSMLLDGFVYSFSSFRD